MKLIRAVFGISVLAIAAALPWIVQDHLQGAQQARESAIRIPSEATGSVRQTNPVGSKVLSAVRNWIHSGTERDTPGKALARHSATAVHTSAEVVSGNVPTSDRAHEAAKRVTPVLEPELTKLGLKIGDPVFMRFFKEEKEMELWIKGEKDTEFQLFKTYKIAKHSGKPGPKIKEGDRQAPEGFYYVPPQNLNPNSRFHLSFDLGFPNAYDRYHGRTGTFLMVHGGAVSIGCFAMTDPKIEEIYTLASAALSGGQKFFRVHSFPFRMSDKRMNEEGARKVKWLDFWANLKEGYDYFEMMKLPPNVEVKDGKYMFSAG